jgi:glucokinase
MNEKKITPSFPWLVADVGGTNARFGLIQSIDGAASEIETIPVAEHSGLAEATALYLRNKGVNPQHAAIAVATPLAGDLVQFTNSPWSFSRERTQHALNLSTFLVLNDFEALALALPRLRATQLQSIRSEISRSGTLAVVGPGTGLGVGGVTKSTHGWVPIPGEGGHATVAAFDAFEAEILNAVRQNFSHVSGERLLSGIGLPTLYSAVGAALGQTTQPLKGKQIVEAGLARTDAVADKTIDVFCAMLGSFCGNTVLTLGARNGLFIGGGIVPRLGARFAESQFLPRFEAKGRFQPYLAAVPIALITDTLAALTGAALAIEQSAALN